MRLLPTPNRYPPGKADENGRPSDPAMVPLLDACHAQGLKVGVFDHILHSKKWPHAPLTFSAFRLLSTWSRTKTAHLPPLDRTLNTSLKLTAHILACIECFGAAVAQLLSCQWCTSMTVTTTARRNGGSFSVSAAGSQCGGRPRMPSSCALLWTGVTSTTHGEGGLMRFTRKS